MSFIRKNFARGTLASDLGAGAVQLEVQAGHTLPTSVGSFRLVIWDNTNFPDPADDPLLEIVTASYSGTPNFYDIVRAQEDTSDVAHSTGNRAALHYTAGMSEDDIYTSSDFDTDFAGKDLDDLAAGVTNIHLTVALKLEYDAAYSHVSSDGSDHSFIDQDVTATGDPQFNSISSLSTPLSVSNGGTGAATFTDHSLLVGSGTDAFTALGAATNGQLPIGSTGADPVLATLTEGANITITNGAGSITIAADVDFATGIDGTTNQITVTDDGDDTITLSLPQDYDTGATPTLGNLTLSGTENVGLDLSGGTWANANINLAANPVIQHGGIQLLKVDDTNSNFFLGSDVFQNDNGQYNVGIGYQAGYYNDTTGGVNNGDHNTYIGYWAGYGSGSSNKGANNTAIGSSALKNNTTGQNNLGLGKEACYYNTTGIYNTAIGTFASRANRTGSYNVAIGSSALLNNTSSVNLGIGYSALGSEATNGENIAIGTYAGRYQNGGSYNTIIGRDASYRNVTGDRNVIIGHSSAYGVAAQSHSRNVFIGERSAYSNTTGSDNVFLGYRSGYRQTTNSNLLIIDNQDRGSAANEAANSLLYGVFNAAPSSQYLKVNGDLYLSGDNRKIYMGAGNDAEIYYDGTNLILSTKVVGTGGLSITGGFIATPDEITATDAGVAASIYTTNTEVTTNGDSDLDNVTLANGTSGQVKHIYCVAQGNAADTWKITPANMVGGTQITFSGAGEGCTLVYADNEGWVVVANNGGTIT